MIITQDKHFQFKKDSKVLYGKLTEVYCKPLRSKVKFNSDGFQHMIFKGNREKRNVADQRNRLVLIPLIKPVLYNAKKIHETRIDEIVENGIKKLKTCHAFIEYVGNNADVKVKVIVKQINNGDYFFYSVMKMNKNIAKNKNTPK